MPIMFSKRNSSKESKTITGYQKTRKPNLQKPSLKHTKFFAIKIKAGATAEEIAETLAVTMVLCGGPADVWTRKIFDEEIEKLKTEA